jgi:hypothetical protein
VMDDGAGIRRGGERLAVDQDDHVSGNNAPLAFKFPPLTFLGLELPVVVTRNSIRHRRNRRGRSGDARKSRAPPTNKELALERRRHE